MGAKEGVREEVGKVVGYFKNVGVAALELMGSLKIGDTIHIKGSNTDFKHRIDSMQINREPVDEAGENDDVGIKVPERVRPNDKIFLIKE